MVAGDNAIDSGSEFIYDSLDTKPRTFRLIKLLSPARSHNPLRGDTPRIQIIEQSLEDGALFDALSYAWGDVGRSLPSRPVIVETGNGRRTLKIYRPLEVALLNLERCRAVTLPLFVDQICINQRNNDEKANQVKLMGDIYTGCDRVIIWLGPGTRYSDQYYRFVSDVCSECVMGRLMGPHVGHFKEVFDAVMDPSIDVSGVEREDRDDLTQLMRHYGTRYPLQGASDVLGRLWFNRLWIIQEVCLAPKAVFVCGNQSLCFDCFRTGVLYYTIWNKVHRLIPRFLPFWVLPADIATVCLVFFFDEGCLRASRASYNYVERDYSKIGRDINSLQLLAPSRGKSIQQGDGPQEQSVRPARLLPSDIPAAESPPCERD